jgi:hypothetical protein
VNQMMMLSDVHFKGAQHRFSRIFFNSLYKCINNVFLIMRQNVLTMWPFKREIQIKLNFLSCKQVSSHLYIVTCFQCAFDALLNVCYIQVHSQYKQCLVFVTSNFVLIIFSRMLYINNNKARDLFTFRRFLSAVSHV